MEIVLTQGKVAVIDDEHWPLVGSLKWCAARFGTKWYAIASIPATRHRKIKHHRLVTAALVGCMVDHRNGDTLDCRKSNLHACNNVQNQQNSGSRMGSSRFKGVSRFASRGKWQVAFRFDGRYVFVGYFDDEVAAPKANADEVTKLAGEFTRPNFPDAA